MNIWQRIRLLLILVATCALPASANNPPQPDGMFSLLLIFPVVLIGMRLADARPDPNAKRRPVLIGLLMALAFIISAAGDGIGAFGLLAILIYGIVRGAQIVRRGKGWKSWVIGTTVIAWVLFAGFDYVVSLAAAGPRIIAINEAQAINRLRMLSTAESNFAKQELPGSAAGPIYASVAKLQEENLLDRGYGDNQAWAGYRLGEVMQAPIRQFLFYEVPTQPQISRPRWPEGLPGASVINGVLGGQGHVTGVRTFAVDETGIIRWAVRPAGKPVTREEALQWEPLQ